MGAKRVTRPTKPAVLREFLFEAGYFIKLNLALFYLSSLSSSYLVDIPTFDGNAAWVKIGEATSAFVHLHIPTRVLGFNQALFPLGI